MSENHPIWFFVLLVPIISGLIFNCFGSDVSAAETADITTTITITVCGNGVKDTGEQCDGADLNSQTCVGLGYDRGTLACRADCSFNASNCETDDDTGGTPGGGGGGGSYVPPATKAIIQGKAYPGALVTVLEDGKVVATVTADPQANFKVTIANLTSGTYSFGVWAEDDESRKSITFTFTTSIKTGTITSIGGIFIPPTIELNDTFFQRGDNLNVLGQTAPESEVSIFMHSPGEPIVKKIKAEKDGAYFYAFDTTPLEDGSHIVKAKATSPDRLLSTFSKTLAFSVGKERPKPTCEGADLNGDNRVNLIDFSILLYWWDKPNDCANQNGDDRVNLTDFSIMLYYWTG